MKTIVVIGIGSGDPEHLTLQAVAALQRAHVHFVARKPGARDELAEIRRRMIAEHAAPGHRVAEIEDAIRDREASAYRDAVEDWRDGRRRLWADAIDAGLADDEVGAFLVWGDPSLYDSTIAILESLDVDFSVIPGISSVQALAAQHRIPLNQVGGAVQVMPGRLLRENGWPQGVDDVVVMLDASASYRAVAEPGIDIYWGAYVGSPDDELLRSGPLDEVTMASIEAARAEARARKGWIMDTYLLRRRRTEDSE